jgi:hypothetical protein
MSTINWTPVSSGTLPDDEQTVMVAIEGEADAWPGFVVGGQWFDLHGTPVSVYAWAPMIATPRA